MNCLGRIEDKAVGEWAMLLAQLDDRQLLGVDAADLKLAKTR
jgi:hypothetical protein